MSIMNYLTLELPQPADNKALSGVVSDSDNNKSGGFSRFMEQQNEQEKRGNRLKETGNNSRKERSVVNRNDTNNVNAGVKKRENKSHNDDTHNVSSSTRNKPTGTKTQAASQKTTSATSEKTSSLTASDNTEQTKDTSPKNEDLTKNTHNLAANDTAEEKDKASQQKSDEESSHNPEQLLSFLHASEKVLSPDAVVKIDKKPIDETTALLNADNGDKKTPLKTDKTLIAQSVSLENTLNDSEMLKNVKNLLDNKEQLADAAALKNIASELSKNVNNTALIPENELNIDGQVASEDLDGDALQAKVNDVGGNKAVTQKQSAELAANKNTLTDLLKNNELSNASRNIAQQNSTLQNNVQQSSTQNSAQQEEALTLAATDNITDIEQLSTSAKNSQTQQGTAATNGVIKTAGDLSAKNNINGLLNPSDKTKGNTDVNPQSASETSDADAAELLINNSNEQVLTNPLKSEVKKDLNAHIANKADNKTLNANNETVKETTNELANETTNELFTKALETELTPQNNENKLNQVLNPMFNSQAQQNINSGIGESTFIQEEQTFEHIMQGISSDLAQTQKNASIAQAETISIMRKDFTDALKEKVMVMIHQKIQQVDIQLDPPELGRMQVRINMQNDQAVVNFVVQNQQAKEAIDQNLDKLKHMMADSGVDVGGSNVKQQAKQSSDQQQDNQTNGGSFIAGEEGMGDGSLNTEHTKAYNVSSTGVDYYA